MNKYVVLYSELEKESRDFVAELAGDVQKIDWYKDRLSVNEYVALALPHPSIFPSVVDTELKIIAHGPESLEAGIELIEAEVVRQEEAMADKLRKQRNDLLASTDWVLLSDSKASEACREAFIAYRQELRDMEFSGNVAFPERPEYEKIEE